MKEVQDIVNSSLEAIEESSDAYFRLYESQEHLIDFMEQKEEIAPLKYTSKQGLKSTYADIYEFAMEEKYWDNLVQMETDVNYFYNEVFFTIFLIAL